MAIELRTPTDADIEAMLRLDGVAFGAVWKPEEFEKVRPIMDLDRFRIAVDGGDLVGMSGSYGFEMTVPGGASLPTGGVTWVAVLVTHRRQGLLRRMLDAVHADIADRGEPMAALTASEGAIYERFGYGIAALDRNVEIECRRAQLRSGVAARAGSVRIVDGDALVPALVDRWERARRGRAGEISRSETWHRMQVARRGQAAVHAIHDDGYAVWTVAENWNDGLPMHHLRLVELAAATPEAHRDLWATVLSVDLVGSITSSNVPLDDPLPYLLEDHRVVRTTAVRDGVWLRVRDVPACFGARTYGTDDDIVVEADGVRWRLGASGCRKVRSRPDLVGDGASLSALLLGGVRPSALVAGGRLTARSTEALRRADAAFVTAPTPYNQTGF